MEKPDFISVTGDTLSGYYWDGREEHFTQKRYGRFADVIEEMGYPWAFTAGNHDSQGDMTRQQLSEFDRSYSWSMTQPNAKPDLHHEFNYMIPVYDENGEEIVFRNWYLDTGDRECLGVDGFSCVWPDQIDWFR
jgi:hypothetical protein